MSEQMRETGGNRFIDGDATTADLVLAFANGLRELSDWSIATGRRVDLGAITLTTKRISSGRISVTVSGDLTPSPGDLGERGAL